MKFGLSRFHKAPVLFINKTVSATVRESKCVPKCVKTLNFIKTNVGATACPRPMSEAKRRFADVRC
jgi:hypothetical protein